jgi:hypothetical protein
MISKTPRAHVVDGSPTFGYHRSVPTKVERIIERYGSHHPLCKRAIFNKGTHQDEIRTPDNVIPENKPPIGVLDTKQGNHKGMPLQ